MTQKHPKAGLKLVEDKANGPAVIQALRHEVHGLVAVVPDGGKIARAQAVSPQVESGNVYLPIRRSRRGSKPSSRNAAAFPTASMTTRWIR
jgi:predicted phage terminase large subunit-like protein